MESVELQAPAGNAAARVRVAPRRVAVFRALQLGDMLCAVPALRALRRAWPSAHITLIGLPWARDFAARFAHYVDDFLVFPGDPALPEREPDLDAWPAFLQAAAQHDFDLVLQLHGDGSRTNAIVARIPGRAHGGFTSGAGEALFAPWPAQGHEALRLLALPRHLGAPAEDAALEFPLTADDEAQWDAYPAVRELLDQADAPFLCVHAGARAAFKRWPLEHFARVADTMAAATGWRVVLTGSREEQPLTRALAQTMRTPVVDAAAPVPVGALALLVARSRVLVSNDTGVSHIAAGLRVPSVVVFRASDIERWAPLDTTRHRSVWDPQCERVDEVLRHARELIAQH